MPVAVHLHCCREVLPATVSPATAVEGRRSTNHEDTSSTEAGAPTGGPCGRKDVARARSTDQAKLNPCASPPSIQIHAFNLPRRNGRIHEQHTYVIRALVERSGCSVRYGEAHRSAVPFQSAGSARMSATGGQGHVGWSDDVRGARLRGPSRSVVPRLHPKWPTATFGKADFDTTPTAKTD